MGITAPRLRQSRHGVFVFRYLVPPQFQEKLGKKEMRRSLRTKDPAAARLLGLNLNIVIERLLKYLPPTQAMDEIERLLAAGVHGWVLKTKNLEFQTDGTEADSKELAKQIVHGELRVLVDKELEAGSGLYIGGVPIPAGYDPEVAKAVMTPFLPVPQRPMTIEQAIEGYMAGKEGKLDAITGEESEATESQKVTVDRRGTMEAFKAYINEKCTPRLTLASFMHELQVKDIQDFLSYYSKRAPQKLKKDNSKKRDGVNGAKGEDGQSLAPADGKVIVENKTLSVSTMNKQAANMASLIRYCRQSGALLNDSTLVSHHFKDDLKTRIDSLTKKNRASSTYQAFDHDELQKLFEPDKLFWCAGGQIHYIWATLLALHMGFRAKELATLKLKSYVVDKGVDCIQLFIDAAKNQHSARLVPIPDRIKELGFIEYWRHLKEKVSSLPIEQQDEYPLWPNQSVDSGTFNADPGKNISRFFSCYRRMAYFELNLNVKVFHSFRHTVVSVLEAIKVDIKSQEQIVGHAEGDDGVKERSEYWGARAKIMAHAMNKRYTSDVEGYEALSQSARNKNHLDEIGKLFQLDYEGLRLVTKTAQELLVCEDLASKKWTSGFKRNQRKIIEKLPPQLIPKDMDSVSDFSWRTLPDDNG